MINHSVSYEQQISTVTQLETSEARKQAKKKQELHSWSSYW